MVKANLSLVKFSLDATDNGVKNRTFYKLSQLKL